MKDATSYVRLESFIAQINPVWVIEDFHSRSLFTLRFWLFNWNKLRLRDAMVAFSMKRWNDLSWFLQNLVKYVFKSL